MYKRILRVLIINTVFENIKARQHSPLLFFKLFVNYFQQVFVPYLQHVQHV